MVDLLEKAIEGLPNDAEFWAEIENTLALPALRLNRRIMELGMTAGGEIGVGADLDALHPEALAATRRATFELVRRVTDTTRDGIREALLTWQEMGVVLPDQRKRGLPTLIEGLESLFDRQRANRIAVTETTRMFAEGNVAAMVADDTVLGEQWLTARDERVCPICGPRQGKVWPKGQGPAAPAHVL